MKQAHKLKAFDITRFLDSKEALAEYLSQVLEDGDKNELIRALRHITKMQSTVKKLILKEVSQDGKTHISYGKDRTAAEVVILEAKALSILPVK